MDMTYITIVPGDNYRTWGFRIDHKFDSKETNVYFVEWDNIFSKNKQLRAFNNLSLLMEQMYDFYPWK